MRFFEITEPADRKKIEQAMQSFVQFISSGEELEHEEVADKLYQSLQQFGVNDIETSQSDLVDAGDMNLNASYDPADDEDGEDPINIELVFSKEDDTISFSPRGVSMIKDRIVDALEHEMIHLKQFRKRDFAKQRDYRSKSKKDDVKRAQEYMGNDDEIEAFAKNIASELIRKVDKDGAIQLLRMANKTAQFKDEVGNLLSPNLFGYLATWDFDTKNPVIKKLLKKVYNYVQMS